MPDTFKREFSFAKISYHYFFRKSPHKRGGFFEKNKAQLLSDPVGVSLLKSSGAEIAQSGVTPHLIVIAFDVLKDTLSGIFQAIENPSIEEFGFEAAE